MPVSGRRYQALQAENARLLAELTALQQDMRRLAEERDAARAALDGLRVRAEQLAGRELTLGEALLFRRLRASEAARAQQEERLMALQNANDALCREAVTAAGNLGETGVAA